MSMTSEIAAQVAARLPPGFVVTDTHAFDDQISVKITRAGSNRFWAARSLVESPDAVDAIVARLSRAWKAA